MKGIYSITCTVNERVYVGRSDDIQKRQKSHLTSLQSGKHVNKELLEDFERYGAEGFVFKVEKITDNLADTMRAESLMYYRLKENGINLYNKAGIIDYRSISKEDSLKLGQEIVERCEQALADEDVKSYEWSLKDIAEQLDQDESNVLIAIREYLYTNYSQIGRKYSARLHNHYPEHYLSFMNVERLNSKMRNFSVWNLSKK